MSSPAVRMADMPQAIPDYLRSAEDNLKKAQTKTGSFLPSKEDLEGSKKDYALDFFVALEKTSIADIHILDGTMDMLNIFAL
mmetsp:Transcript_16523/g.42149  ORF Transcript_16523/g.42149 Transcript_16523/m.42149 type:complete len:82 (+) Transcript_16523:259-504(+)